MKAGWEMESVMVELTIHRLVLGTLVIAVQKPVNLPNGTIHFNVVL